MKRWLRLCLVCAALVPVAEVAHTQAVTQADSDGDGLSDALENALLQAFRPTLMVSVDDCSNLPAVFTPGLTVPTVLHEDGTLYGQAFPRQGTAGQPRQIELHYYHLWRRDCGRMGHLLDAEHVSVLLQAKENGQPGNADGWMATYWYAAAHEDTVCDASQLTRAETLGAVTHGATVWISSGKHASFLNEELCRSGCGGDGCVHSKPVTPPAVINLGEAAHPMNGSVWMSSARWPLQNKLTRTDFPEERLSRLNRLSANAIVPAKLDRHGAHAAIRGGNTTVDGVLHGSEATQGALSTGHRNANVAVIEACDIATSAMGRAGQATGRALRRSWRSVGHMLPH